MLNQFRRIAVTDQQISESYAEHGSSNKVAKALGVGQSTVLRVLTRLGVEMDGLARYRAEARAFNDAECAEISAAYAAGERSSKLAEKHGVTIYTIKEAIRRAGGNLRENPSPTLLPGEDERIRELHLQGLSQSKIALTLDRSQAFVSRRQREMGLEITRHLRGEAHGAWQGGRYVTAEGYVRVLVAKDDPVACMRNNTGYVLEHRLVMARKLGRPLASTETVHHIDGDRAHNLPDNLQLRQGKHGKGAVTHCLDCGSTNLGHQPIAQ